MAKIVGQDTGITISDDVRFILDTTDGDDCAVSPYQITNATVYFVSREFTDSTAKEYERETLNSNLQAEYNLVKRQICLKRKEAVRVATTQGIQLTGPRTIDGVSVVSGDRVLVKNQTNSSENGIYVVTEERWARSNDANSSDNIVKGMYVFVENGIDNINTGWVLDCPEHISLGTTQLNFFRFSYPDNLADAPDGNSLETLNLLRKRIDESKSVSSFFYKNAIPVKTFGGYTDPDTGELFPAWLNPDLVPSELKEKTIQDNIIQPYYENDEAVKGKFVLEWKPLECREGDYFICWSWMPNLAGRILSSHMFFMLEGDSRLNTSIPTHRTRPDKYEILMDRYLPEMFKTIISENDLTPTVLQEFNKSVARGFTFIEDMANQIIDLLDANATHEQLLPLLSNMFNLKLRSSDPTLWRRQIKKAIPNFKRKGTIEGLRNGLSDVGIKLLKITKLWQVVSKYTFQEHFVYSGSDEFELSKKIILPIDSNFRLWLRPAAHSEWQDITSDHESKISLTEDSLTWIDEPLEQGDQIRIIYKFREIPPQEQSLEDYIQTLPLMDDRDEREQEYPPKNWNVRLVEEDDDLFDILVPVRHPISDPIIWGRVRTEFPYSENAYNMEEYNGCCVGSTLVITENGIKKIKNIKNDKLIMTEFGFKSFEELKNQGKKSTLNITTSLGRNIIVTPNHRFKIFNESGFEWRQADQLEIGDYILCKKGNCGSIPKNKGFDKELWYLAGHLYGDGNLYEKNNLRSFRWLISEKEPEIKELISKIIIKNNAKSQIFCIKKHNHQKHTKLKCNEDLYRISSSSVQLPILNQIIPKYETKGKWRRCLPNSIWESGEEQICSFLRGLFDTDGGIQKRQPLLTTKWKNLAREIQNLLLALGIVSSVTSYNVFWEGKKRKYFRIRIVGKNSRKIFKDKIGFNSNIKNKSLIDAIELENKSILEADRTIIPFGDKIIKNIFPFRKRLSRFNSNNRTREEKRTLTLITRLKQGYQKTIPDNVVSEIHHKIKEFKIINSTETNFIQDYVDNDWFFEKIKSISPGPVEDVFDPLNVKDTSSYVSNGIVSHNSTRESTDPCDIDKEFVDGCGQCQSSKFTVDLEVERLSDDSLEEAKQTISDYMPFHSLVHSLNLSGAMNEFVRSSEERIEALVQFSKEDVLLAGEGQHIFNKAMDSEELASFKRDMLASFSAVPSSGSNLQWSGVVSNQRVVLSSSVLSSEQDLSNLDFKGKKQGFDSISINTGDLDVDPRQSSNLLEVLGESQYEFSVSSVGLNSMEIYGDVESSVIGPLFEYRISNKIGDFTADIEQANRFVLTDVDADFWMLGVISQHDIEIGSLNSAWRLRHLNKQYIVQNVLPDGTLLLSEESVVTPVIGWFLYDGSGNLIKSSNSGSLSTIKLGLVDIGQEQGLAINDYVYIDNSKYKIKSLKNGEEGKFYIENYEEGEEYGKNISIYRRILENKVGQFAYEGIKLISSSNLAISTSNADDIKENFLIFMDSKYYTILSVNSNELTLSGPIDDWTTDGAEVDFMVYKFDKQSKQIKERTEPPVPAGSFERLDRSGAAIIKNIQDNALGAAVSMLNMSNSNEKTDLVKQNEHIDFNIEYKE